jgi:hypothetical protein
MAVAIPSITLSLQELLDRLHDTENQIDDGSDDPHDKWREIKHRIDAFHNLKAIISKKIYRAFYVKAFLAHLHLLFRHFSVGC